MPAFRVLAIDFRGYGQSRGGDRSAPGSGEKYEDVLAAVRYLKENGAKTVSVIGASMGGGATANASIHARPGEIDRLIRRFPCRWPNPSGLTAPSYSLSAGGRARRQGPGTIRKGARAQRAVDPGRFGPRAVPVQTEQGERLMKRILEFLSESKTEAEKR